MESLLQFVQTFWIALQNGTLPHLGAWNYVLLSLLVAVEGPIATLLGAAAASAGYMRPALVFLAAALGNLVSDTLWYQLGYAGKIEWFSRYGRWLGIRPHHLEHLEQGMHDHAAKLLMLAKLTAGLMIPSLIAAGLARVPWRRWFPALLAGETLWTGTLVLIGYYTTEAIKQVAADVEKIGLAGSVLFVVVVLFLLLRRYVKRNKELQAYNEITEEDQPNLNKG
jgi:membrane protein DedA with SNARE-associated domain